MTTFLYGSLLLMAAFGLHVVIWRIRVPGRQNKVLLQCFLGVLVVGSLLLNYFSNDIALLGVNPPTRLAAYARLWMYFISFTLAYMITYSAVEADSPSLVIILKIAATGASGLKEESLLRELNDDALIVPRIRDLLRDKMAVQAEGKYRLRPKGVMLSRLFQLYRNLMGAGKGG